ncbi:hypothetical protein ANCCAN_07708 [Ancylostoma caninum]|uniref:Uncharacterized protein n=1 Tax=Ancylostoma caninum TaxID=29170 RepID=A0A368GRK1_ANCCA|nr:hypothetical protein ANCCAN_07708 [Ancylostoma caninum]
MRDTRTGSSRRIVRTSQPSTSSESENFPSKVSDLQSPRRVRETRRTPRSRLDQECSVKEEGPVSMNSRSQQRRKAPARLDEDTSSSKLPAMGENVPKEPAEPNSPASSVCGLRRSAREPRPKRTLSPTPISPKRRPRLKRPSMVVMGYDSEEIESKNMDATKSDIHVQAELPYHHESACGSQQSLVCLFIVIFKGCRKLAIGLLVEIK